MERDGKGSLVFCQWLLTKYIVFVLVWSLGMQRARFMCGNSNKTQVEGKGGKKGIKIGPVM